MDQNFFVKLGKYNKSIIMKRCAFDQSLELTYMSAELLMSKSGSNYKIANCALEGRLFEAELWSNTGLLKVMH